MAEAHLKNTIGNIYAALGQFQNAEQMAREAVALRRSDPSTRPAELAESLFDLAHHLWSQGKLAEAERFAREGLNLARRSGPAKKDALVAKSLAQLGVIVQDRGKLSEAEGLFRESLAVRKQLVGNEHPTVAQTLNTLSGVLTLEGKTAEAEKTSRDALTAFGWASQTIGPPDAEMFYTRGNDFFEKANLAEAEACFRQALAFRRKHSGGQDVEIALSSLASTLRREQRFPEAEPLYRECLASRETNCPNAWYTHYTRAMLGATLLGRRKYDEAEPLLVSGYEGMREREDKIRARTKVLTETMQSFIQLFEATSRPEKAAEWKASLATVLAAGPRGRPAWPRFSSSPDQAKMSP
jgi:tetratricopeptide (TPR) repeat protein